MLNTGTTLHTIILIPVLAANLHADLRASPRQRRTLVTLEKEKANEQRHRGVCVNAIVSPAAPR